MSCAVCCDTYSQDPVICGFCDFAACNTCCETYILDQTSPKCMNASCGKDWSRKFIKAKLGGSFMSGKFKTHMENVLYDRERALMPATQPLVERKLKGEKMKNELNLIKEQIANLEIMKARLEHNIGRHKSGEPLIENWEDNRTRYYAYETPPTAVCAAPSKSNYVRACPAEDCRGFLNQKWTCGLCDKKTCRNCHEVINIDEKEHVCDPNNVATAQLLEKDTKPCPKCQTQIFKIDGCDQIWCTQCHTAFSWRTGHIETKIHNPHYYEWKRNNGGLEPTTAAEPDARNGCYEIDNATYDELMNAVKNGNHTDLRWAKPSSSLSTIIEYDKDFNTVLNMSQTIIHNREVEMPKFTSDIFKNNEELRIKFMSNEITENQFKNLIQRYDKKSKKNEEIYNVFQFFNSTMNDLTYRIIENLRATRNGNHNFRQLFAEMEVLREYCNTTFADISETYDCVLYNFDKWKRFVTVKSEKDNKKLGESLEKKACEILKSNNYYDYYRTNDTLQRCKNSNSLTTFREALLEYLNSLCNRRMRDQIINNNSWLRLERNSEGIVVAVCDMVV